VFESWRKVAEEMKKLIALILMLMYTNSCFAQQAYICVADSSTGFKYNSNSRIWEQTGFRVSEDKKLLKKVGQGWEWSSFGSTYGEKCGEINSYGLLNCDILFGTLRFSKNTLRYIETYTVGYIDGDKGGNTPAITIGKCSPL
jgi:hypothetical protein